MKKIPTKTLRYSAGIEDFRIFKIINTFFLPYGILSLTECS